MVRVQPLWMARNEHSLKNRRLARQDRWEDTTKVLSTVRQLPAHHAYLSDEMQHIASQLEEENMMIGGAGFKNLMKEMWTIPDNRRRALISVGVMISQQMTGTNAMWVVSITCK